jgi:aminodeoxyfutalosine synthase
MMRDIRTKVENHTRLTDADALWLFENADLGELGNLANEVNLQKNGKAVFYNINRHINPTNICALSCKFCAYSKKIGDDGAYAYDIDEMIKKAAEAVAQGATELHMVGGLHPRWNFQRYVDMIAAMHQAFPDVHLKAFTAVELDWMARKARKTIAEVMLELKAAGLGSFPGGGAEIFHPEIRDKICDTKVSGDQWIETHRTAHKLGLRSNCTMLYGHIENYSHRVDHMRRLRELQDETAGFNVFIPLAFQPFQNEMGVNRYTFGADDLRTIAVARLYLDNFKNIKSYWVMLGQDIAQLALQFGANDLDGTVLEEKISRAAGGRAGMIMTRRNLEQLIKRSDRIPVERTTLYEPVNQNDVVHLTPVSRAPIDPAYSSTLNALLEGQTMTPAHLWNLAHEASFQDVVSVLKKTKSSDSIWQATSDTVFVRLSEHPTSESFVAKARELIFKFQTPSRAGHDLPMTLTLDVDTNTSREHVEQYIRALGETGVNTRTIVRGLSWAYQSDDSQGMSMIEIFASLGQLGVVEIEESPDVDCQLDDDLKWKILASALAADISVRPSITLRSQDETVDWSHWADCVTIMRGRLASNPIIQTINFNAARDNHIMPSEYLKALALTRLALPSLRDIRTPLLGFSTLSPQRGLGASDDQHPVMKLISVMGDFGSSGLGALPVNIYSAARVAEDVYASGRLPFSDPSVHLHEPKLADLMTHFSQLRHVPRIHQGGLR